MKGAGGPKAAESKAGAPSVSAAPVMARVIGKEQAEKVFNDYAFARAFAEQGADVARVSAVEAGPLLEQTKARFERQKAKGWATYKGNTFERSVFVIPTEREQPGYPRTFAVISERDSGLEVRARAVHHFAQAEAGGRWMAVAESWVNGAPPTEKGAGVTPRYKALKIEVRDKEIAAPQAEPGAGGGVLSVTAAEDRKVCGRYAQYLSFTAPRGERESEHFVPGPLTSGVVDEMNTDADQAGGRIRHVFGYEAVGVDLPVVKLVDGASLVTCTYVRTSHLKNKATTAWFTFKKNTPIDDMLGGGGRHWADVKSRYAVTVVFEVPARGPADVVASNSLDPQLLSAQGTRG
ncbi:hypothetical protein ACODT5_41030 [Streptomyces sp. 5.8]|uniref:hypothetical protein n=1 Tax=Streptomyces sp. 5.8 TaxID=3406571 RepID=UPI003BB5C98E